MFKYLLDNIEDCKNIQNSINIEKLKYSNSKIMESLFPKSEVSKIATKSSIMI
jgi:hypothetical protein